MCIFHIKQTRLASVFTSVDTFPRLFFNITTKDLCNLIISKLVNRNTEEHPGSHSSGIFSEPVPWLQRTWQSFPADTQDTTWIQQTHPQTDPASTRNFQTDLTSEPRAVMGSWEGVGNQTTFTLIYPSAGKMSLAHILLLSCTFSDIKIQ